MSLTNPSSAPASHPAKAEAFQRVERLAKVLDEAVTIPFTKIKVGLDSVIGLLPGIGDFAGLAIGGYLLLEAHRLGAPADIKWKMARNTAVDSLAGLVPGVGDAVDVLYRSNRRNVELLRGHFRPLEAPRKSSSPVWLLAVVRLALLAGIGSAAWYFWGRS
jgi:hypothetical protein